MPPDSENVNVEPVKEKRRRRTGRAAVVRPAPAGAACFAGDCKQDAVALCIQCGRPYCARHGGGEAGYGQRCRECYAQMARTLVEVHFLAGQLPEAATLLGTGDPASAPPERLYYRGLALAASGDLVAAEECFQHIITRPGGSGDFDEVARQVLSKILSARAAQRLQANDIAGAADDLRQAIALSKDTSKQYSLLMGLTLQAGFAYLQAGRLTDALRAWRETQAQEPHNLQVAHSLAVVCYRLASETEPKYTPETDTYWREAIANWVMIIVNEPFWSAWGNGRTKAVGTTIDAAIMQEVRDNTRVRLSDDFREFRSRYLADPARSADVERHTRYEADFLRELHAAEAMLKAIQKSNPAGCPLQVACGPLMLDRWRQIPSAAGLVDAVEALSKKSPDLRRYLSDLGPYYVMIHDLRRYEDAYAGLEKLATGRHKNAEAAALLGEAYLAQGNELVEAQSFDRALPLLEKAMPYKRDEAMPLLVQVAIKQARAFFDANNIQEVIDLLERLMKAYSITDVEFKAELSRGYFERGLMKNRAKDNQGSLQDLRRAREINPNNEQVNQNLVKAIMNVAVEVANADRLDEAFSLVMEVIVMLPDNLGEFREPISVIIFRHGVEMANRAAASVQYSAYKGSACPALREARDQMQVALQFAPPDNYSYRANVQEQIAAISNIINRIC